MSVVLVTSTVAIIWNPAQRISLSEGAVAGPRSVVASGRTRAVVAYVDSADAGQGVYGRVTDEGGGWSLQLLSTPAAHAESPSLGAWGASVDLVWRQNFPGCTEGSCQLMYRRSLNGGGSWSEPLALSPFVPSFAGSPGHPTVARSSTGQVTATWTEQDTGKILVRTSTDGGVTWSARRSLGITTNRPNAPAPARDGFPVVAIGSGVTYVAYYTDFDTLKVRRSFDGAVTWTTAATVTDTGNGFATDLAAAGSRAIVGYTTTTAIDSWTTYRRTADKGATWTAARALAPPSGFQSFEPSLAVRSSTWLVTFTQCRSESCDVSSVYLRESTDGGATWTSPSRASPLSIENAAPGGATIIGPRLVIFTGYSGLGKPTSSVWARSGFVGCEAAAQQAASGTC